MYPGRCLSFVSRIFLISSLILLPSILHAQNNDVWNSPAFSVEADALRRAAAEIKPEKDAEATILLNELEITYDATGRRVKKSHLIYRIETQDAVENWAEIRAEWEPWYQARPEMRARVITADGVVHTLDSKTLTELPVHENQPDLYSDERAYGGPLPALAAGAIGEEEIVTRDTAPFFSGGTFEQYFLIHSVAVDKTRFLISHPESLPLHYVLHLLPDASVKKSTKDGVETILIENGRLQANTDVRQYAPSDVVLSPMIEYSTGSSWQRVATDYVHQVNDKLRLADVQPMVSKLELKPGANLESIRRIVALLHKNVRYTGIEFGESSLIPQFPSETLKRKYGDCKDKATLLVAMLRAAGIPATLALLSAGPGEDVNPDLPGMGGFDHAIVYVPATASSPELWIDATAQSTHVGNLPDMDYGRWALIADEKTTALKKIPELTAENNLHIETREFTLADYGPAKITEKNEQIGPTEADFRDYYAGDAKKVRESSEKYVKDAYLADSLISLDKTDPNDLEKPFVVTFAAKGRRGFTEIENASVYIPHSGIFDGLPDYFYTAEKTPETSDASDEPKRKPRTVDWVLQPFATEWRYKITAPAGFKVRALPANKDEQLGSAHFSQKYSSFQDGSVVEAVLRFDSGKPRLTVDEARTLRDAIVKARGAEGISVAFDQIGYSLLSAGKIKEALVVDRQLVAAHPKEALHRIRLARALLAAGLGEKARTVIKEAVALDPKSAQVALQEGWILEHDLIGRRLKKGFDYEGSVAAYRRAKQLDPKDKDIRATLAMLLEYDADGVRYSKKARLEDAVVEFSELKKLDESYARTYEDFVPYDLWYLGKCKELTEYIAGLPGSDLRKGLTVACTALTDSTEAAIKKSLQITSDEQGRSKVLINAGWFILRVRKYPQAADLLAAGAHGQNESPVLPLAARLQKTSRFEDLKIDPASPVSVIQNFFGLLFSGATDPRKFTAFIAKEVQESSDLNDPEEMKEFRQMIFSLRGVAAKSGMPMETLGDIALSNAHYSTEGNDSTGYKITMESPGAPASDVFVVREDGQYKAVEFAQEGKVPESMAVEVLRRLHGNDLAGARKWLDWAREKVHISGGDDPLAGQPFPRFWTKGQAGDENAIRTAALILLPSKDLKGDNLEALVRARNQAGTDAARADLNLVLAYAYSAQAQWAELQGVAEELVKASPESFIAFRFAASAYAGLKKFDDWDRLLQSRMQAHPDEPDYVRSASELARFRGQFGKARELLKGLIDRGKSTSNDLNSYAWDALYAPEKVDQDAIDAAHRASELTKESNFSILHTLACLYAGQGKTKEARELLMKTMEAGELEEPDSAVWLALAMIAEQYGESDAARAMYNRVEKPKVDSPSSNYALAQVHLAALQNGTVTAKAAGQ